MGINYTPTNPVANDDRNDSSAGKTTEIQRWIDYKDTIGDVNARFDPKMNKGQRSVENNVNTNIIWLNAVSLNAYYATGFYNLENSPTGSPWGDSRWYWMQVFSHIFGAHWQRQVVWDMTGGTATMWTRLCAGDATLASSWSPWVSINDDTGWIGLTYQNGWVNYDNQFGPAGYRRKNGVVYCRGLVKNGPMNFAIFILPVGFRPGVRTLISTLSDSGSSRIDVDPTGEVIPSTGGTGWQSLNNIAFPV